ncbi:MULTISPECIES: DUF6111 family protein [unclassified Methylobacterium]|uniref:DUF6111 family protein n=1 Tax=unclassified Methylobacterium TaxID=2615210 RepID=UPI000369E700|nr:MULTISPECIES: DUF6111 family protein [unclassified Methylobacterium]KQP42084.1 hypothetical protein ASF34_10265 [Methylobacterium sp. Leaf106]
MIRRLFEEALIFLLPFVLFGLYLAIRGRNPRHGTHWEGSVFRLTMGGLVLVILSLVVVGLTGEKHRGGYVPPSIENGQVVPGHFQ